MSQLEILLWLHSDSFTECRVTAVLWAPPICHFVSSHWRQRICSIFQLDFSYLNVLHLCAPPLWHFNAAHFKQLCISLIFSTVFAARGLFRICPHHVFSFYRALHHVLRTFSSQTPVLQESRYCSMVGNILTISCGCCIKCCSGVCQCRSPWSALHPNLGKQKITAILEFSPVLKRFFLRPSTDQLARAESKKTCKKKQVKMGHTATSSVKIFVEEIMQFREQFYVPCPSSPDNAASTFPLPVISNIPISAPIITTLQLDLLHT